MPYNYLLKLNVHKIEVEKNILYTGIKLLIGIEAIQLGYEYEHYLCIIISVMKSFDFGFKKPKILSFIITCFNTDNVTEY